MNLYNDNNMQGNHNNQPQQEAKQYNGNESNNNTTILIAQQYLQNLQSNYNTQQILLQQQQQINPATLYQIQQHLQQQHVILQQQIINHAAANNIAIVNQSQLEQYLNFLLQQAFLTNTGLYQNVQQFQKPTIPQPAPPILTLQDREPTIPAIYNGVNTCYPGLRLINNTPPIYLVDDFLTIAECHFLINVASDSFQPAPVVGPGSGEISKSRTSDTCYLARQDLPILLEKVCFLTGKPWNHAELPQVGRYLPSQQYLQHYDAFDLSNDDGRRFAQNGGQRVVTILVYLNHVHRGGNTFFPSLNLSIQPKQGMALVFFPSTVDGLLDKQALHAALPAVDVKFVSQIWVRQGPYEGYPSKRLSRVMDNTIN